MNTEKVYNDCVSWIRNWFDKNGKNAKAVIGVSGGADSTVVSKLLVDALGDRVIQVIIPNGEQKDIEDAKRAAAVTNPFSVPTIINIGKVYTELTKEMANLGDGSEQTVKEMSENSVYNSNTPARLRMTVLYGVAALCNGRVVNTCNLSEDWVGYSTKFGDAAGDFAPIAKLTKTEVRELGDYMELPHDLVHKTPSDGMCGKSDEEKLGFTYEQLDTYIRGGKIEKIIADKIDNMHNNPNVAKKIAVRDEDVFEPEM